MRRAASHQRRLIDEEQEETETMETKRERLIGHLYPTRATLSVPILASVGIAALLFPSTVASSVESVLCRIEDAVWGLLAHANAGVYFAAFWLSTVYAPFHYWIMDTLKGDWACGNKFEFCRPWN